MIPPCLVDTAVGNLLANRMIHDNWVEPMWEWVQDEIDKVVTQFPTNSQKLELQAKMHIKRSSPCTARCCDYCNVAMTKAETKKCNRCHEARYCSPQCQRSAWPNHKPKCSPPLSKLEQPNVFGALQVPAHVCFETYMSWYNNMPLPNTRPPIGICMMPVDAFIAWHGKALYRKTLLSLAVNGYPHLILASILEPIRKKEDEPRKSNEPRLVLPSAIESDAGGRPLDAY